MASCLASSWQEGPCFTKIEDSGYAIGIYVQQIGDFVSRTALQVQGDNFFGGGWPGMHSRTIVNVHDTSKKHLLRWLRSGEIKSLSVTQKNFVGFFGTNIFPNRENLANASLFHVTGHISSQIPFSVRIVSLTVRIWCPQTPPRKARYVAATFVPVLHHKSVCADM
jgi:hypothetical protein